MKSIGKTACGGCGRYFTSTSEFDAHRVGAFGLPPDHADRRRCATEGELRRDGWECETMSVKGGDGSRVEAEVWFRPARRQAARESFAKRAACRAETAS